ncbi:hypothetical protein WAI453_012326 [Rhynchosporium graminicola]|uniref:Uncharacterized protein n=1 Tax=Rhynchosporium graminicola TaxID=2792576 RepID=A0A1E1KYY2_9HELO|nr:uncharacterized protein RCO7_06142 [Rhynchosporium commune]
MKNLMKFCLTFSSAITSLAYVTTHSPVKGLKSKRALLSCLETYGGGSVTCGGADSLFCYDPSLGDTCCSMDNGYCKAGGFCAPVAGFCCTNGEYPGTCVAGLNFALLAPYLISSQMAVSTSAPSISATSASASTPEGSLKSTSTVQIQLASATAESPVVSISNVSESSLDIDGMTPELKSQVGNKITTESACVNTTSAAVATKTANGNLLAYTGAAVANKKAELGSAMGLLIIVAGIAL